MRGFGLVLAVIAGFLAMIALGIALDLGGLFYQQETAGFRGKSEAERTLESGRSRIQLYNEFFDLCAGIQAKEAQIDALEANSSMTTSRRSEAITATRIARQTLIADYNNRASRNYTSARFKDAKLPFRIPSDPYKGRKTSCAS